MKRPFNRRSSLAHWCINFTSWTPLVLILKETFFTYRFYKADGVQLEQNLNVHVHVLHADESFQEKPTLSEISINRKNILNIAHPCFGAFCNQ
ncbi:hypothetical protein ACROYT_G002484 [Oculina patagonica]